jgi:hypothetical protein
LAIDVFNQSDSLLGTLAANAADLQFLGFHLNMGQTADHLIFRSAGNGVDAFGMDNIALVSAANAVPEPSTITLWFLGAVTLIGLGWRRAQVKFFRDRLVLIGIDRQSQSPNGWSLPGTAIVAGLVLTAPVIRDGEGCRHH